MMAKLIANVHKAPTDWFEPYREKIIELYPHLSKAKKGSHIWLFSTRLEWYNEHKGHHIFWQNAGFKPLSPAARRLVTVHSDFHEGNKLVNEKGEAFVIDYEFTVPQWAVNDIAYMFSIHQFGCNTPDGRWKFVKTYLQELNMPCSDKDIELFLFDAQCHRLRCFWPALILGEMDKTKENPEYNYK